MESHFETTLAGHWGTNRSVHAQAGRRSRSPSSYLTSSSWGHAPTPFTQQDFKGENRVQELFSGRQPGTHTRHRFSLPHSRHSQGLSEADHSREELYTGQMFHFPSLRASAPVQGQPWNKPSISFPRAGTGECSISAFTAGQHHLVNNRSSGGGVLLLGTHKRDHLLLYKGLWQPGEPPPSCRESLSQASFHKAHLGGEGRLLICPDHSSQAK